MNAVSICRKEVRAVLASPGGYVLMICAGLWFALGALGPSQLSGPVFWLTGFVPITGDMTRSDAAVQIGFMRVATLILIPLISMRLFVQEKRDRSIEILLTSPIRDWEIALGKWLGGMLVYVVILAVSGLAIVAASIWRKRGLHGVAAFEAALLLQGCGLVSIGESLSSVSKHEGTACLVTMLASMGLLRWQAAGVLDGWDRALCIATVGVGWTLTWCTLRSLREEFCA